MILGIDLDNTIICYDGVFWREAVSRGWIPSTTASTKEAVKAALLASFGNERWTLLQGEVYGPLLLQATVFPGFPEFLMSVLNEGHRVEIVSHKSQFPAMGPAVDLRQAATSWLEANALLRRPFLTSHNLHFCDSRDAKIEKIRALACDVFIDDLPEVLEHPAFPEQTRRLLFTTKADRRSAGRWTAFTSWSSALSHVSPQATGLS